MSVCVLGVQSASVCAGSAVLVCVCWECSASVCVLGVQSASVFVGCADSVGSKRSATWMQNLPPGRHNVPFMR